MTDRVDAAFDAAAYTRTAHAAWSSFVQSRLDAQNVAASRGSISLRQQAVDVELYMLQHYTAVARQRKNALLPVGRLPEELLAMIFAHAQSPSRRASDTFSYDWMPSRHWIDVDLPVGKHSATGEKKTITVLRYKLGWIFVTHVCHAWRTAALHNANLWQSVICFALPVRAVSDIISRAGPLPLRLVAHERLHDKLSTAAFSTWLSSPLIRRAEVLDLSTEDDETLSLWTSLLHFPPHRLRELSMTVKLSDTPEKLPEEIFASQCPPTLRILNLCSCFPNWTSPLFSANLTHLSLRTPYVYSDTTPSEAFPNVSDFQRMLSTMAALESLILDEFLPVDDDADATLDVYSFPPSLRRLRVLVESPSLVNDGQFNDFITRCRLPSTIEFVVKVRLGSTSVADEDETHIGQYITQIFQTEHVNEQSSTELILSCQTIGLRFDVGDVDPPWKLARCPSEHRVLSMHPSDTAAMLDKHWEFAPDAWASGCMHGGRLWRGDGIQIRQHVRLLPLTSINSLSLVPNVMSLFPTPEAWSASFGVACNVECISASYLRSIHLLSALSRILEDGSQPMLFPRLDTMVLLAETHPLEEHLALRVALDISFLDVLDTRREAGEPIRRIFVDKRMAQWDIWAEVNEKADILFFE